MRNDNKKVEPLHSDMKWNEPVGKDGLLQFVPTMDAVKITIIDAPSIGRVRKLLATFLHNTWNDHIDFGPLPDAEVNRIVKQVFAGELLPTALETIKLTYAIEGIDAVTTTHVIRHRLNGFSAQTMADRDCRNDIVCMPEAIAANPEFRERFRELHYDAYHLYADMVDSKEVHSMDARGVLPRATSSNFYMVTSCINQIIAFVNARKDEEILYHSNNIMALRLWLEIVKLYPFLKSCVDLKGPDRFPVKQINAGKPIMFAPSEKNTDHVEWSKHQFIYGDKRRDDFPGGERFIELRNQIWAEIDAIDDSLEQFNGQWD